MTPEVFADFDADGRLLGLEVLWASEKLAPGPWREAPQPGADAPLAAE